MFIDDGDDDDDDIALNMETAISESPLPLLKEEARFIHLRCRYARRLDFGFGEGDGGGGWVVVVGGGGA